MRKLSNESYEQWVGRARVHELDNAHKNLKNGMPINEVLEILSTKLTQKIMHPLLTSVKEIKNNYDVEDSKRRYEEAYLKKGKPVADHMNEKD
jgi:glutamyl-tRNA reductase